MKHKKEQKQIEDQIISHGTKLSTKLPKRLFFVVLVTFIISISWMACQLSTQSRQTRELHTDMSVWLAAEFMNEFPQNIALDHLSDQRIRHFQLILKRLHQNYNTHIYVVDQKGKLLLTDTTQSASWEAVSMHALQLKETIIHMLSEHHVESYHSMTGTYQLKMTQTNRPDIYIVGETYLPSWYQEMTLGFILLLFSGLLVATLVYMLTKQAMREWRRQSLAQAIVDPTTLLPNRKAYTLMARKLWVESKQKEIALSMMLLNISLFRQINFSYGLASGDLLLKHIGMLLKDNVQNPHQLYHWGGDEYLIISKNQSNSELYQFAESIRCKIKNLPTNFSGEHISPDVRISLTTVQPNDSMETMLTRLTMIMNTIKSSAPGTIQFD